MESSALSSMSKKLWHMVRVVYYMLRKGVSKHKLMIDLHGLIKHGKIAGKALRNLITFHHHGASSGAHYPVFSCLSIDPNMSFYNPHDVEFSCSNTPAITTKHKNRHNYKYDAAIIAKAFEILNSETLDAGSVVASPATALATPVWSFGKSPMVVRPLRVTDSPFPIKEEEADGDGQVDREADEFIRVFYEQLRRQQQITATPECKKRHKPQVDRG